MGRIRPSPSDSKVGPNPTPGFSSRIFRRAAPSTTASRPFARCTGGAQSPPVHLRCTSGPQWKHSGDLQNFPWESPSPNRSPSPIRARTEACAGPHHKPWSGPLVPMSHLGGLYEPPGNSLESNSSVSLRGRNTLGRHGSMHGATGSPVSRVFQCKQSADVHSRWTQPDCSHVCSP
eukprot:scaffold52026_cov54-Phaeocystis_antarctica.AAC.1